jgi:predicted lipoprotein with Yx(FWY)xxD motif
MTRLISTLLATFFLCLLSYAAGATTRAATSPTAPPPARAGEATAETAAPATRRLSPPELAAQSPVPIWRRGGILVEAGGRALYTFTEDVPGESR